MRLPSNLGGRVSFDPRQTGPPHVFRKRPVVEGALKASLNKAQSFQKPLSIALRMARRLRTSCLCRSALAVDDVMIVLEGQLTVSSARVARRGGIEG